MKQLILILIVTQVFISCNQKKDSIEYKVNKLIAEMTIEEKIGQLNQYSNPYLSTGTGAAMDPNHANYDNMIRNGEVGSFLNVLGVEETLRLQKIAVEESRLGIPLIFAYDVIHGYKTMFPIPLGETASFDRKAMELSARIAAIETAANGIHWTFAPMIDISRDPRWGRIMEGAGEDVFVTIEAGLARIKGFQGDDLSKNNTIAACAKHFVAYGAAIGGREYNAVDISERALYEVHFPAFKAAAEAGVATFMSSFNSVANEPTSGSMWLMTDILRKQWKYDGFVVSDWSSVEELLEHSTAKDKKEAAEIGLNAGIGMDMMGNLYHEYGKILVDEKKVSTKVIDAMVRNILTVKFKLGLFDNPYQYCDIKRQNELTMNAEHLAASRDIAKRSIVLMKNDNNLLPLSKNTKRIAVIGPLATDKDAPIGNWRAQANDSSAVSLLEGIKAAVGDKATITYAEGCKLAINKESGFFVPVEINTTDKSGFAQAIQAAQNADVVIMALGETAYMSGECRSYADISLKGLQLELLRAIRKTGKPIIVTLFTGRPLVLTDVVNETDAILNCWLLGSESGNAIADVLFGDYNPSGKLPASFPYHVGQVPIFYEELNTGRPFNPSNADFSTKYRDIPNTPLFAFGFGLSYTNFEYENIALSKTEIGMKDSLFINVKVKNTGNFDGEEVVQLYIRDLVGKGVARPLRQLKGFEKVMIKKGATAEVKFAIHPNDLAFYRLDKTFGPEAGDFEVYVGGSSCNLPLKSAFVLK
jgi:beta-glucosidase